MLENSLLSRRQVLIGVGGGLGGMAVSGTEAMGAAEAERYIVGTSRSRGTRAAKQEADSVSHVLDFGPIGQAVAGVFSEPARDRLANREDVRYIEADRRIHAIAIDSDDAEVPWGVDRVDAEKAHDNDETGGDDGGADIAIIDTGIDSDHSDLQANLGSGKAFVSCTEDCSCSTSSCGNDNACNESWDDDHNHGTHCAGIADALDNGDGVVGVATEATLHAVKVLDCTGSGWASDVAKGIEYVADHGWDVGNMSLGGDDSETMRDACQYAYDNGVLLVSSAGNDGPCTDCVGYPATYSTVIAVSATTKDDDLADFSSQGSEIEVAAPGKDIYSTVPGGYGTFSGTSTACAHVSGGGGQLMDNGYTNTEARQHLKETAEDLGLSSSEQGAGLLDVETAMLDADVAPSVSWVAPSDGEEVSGTITIQIAASDSEDSDDSLSVEYRVDGATWRTASYNSSSGYYEDSWDSTAVSDGDHTLDARATDTTGNTSSETGLTVTVSNTESAPTIDSYTVTEAGRPNPHANITADWGVSDTDGDLDTVRIEVIDADTGNVVDSHTHNVSGSYATGTDDFKIRHADGETFDVTLTVTDVAGTATTETQTVTE